MEIICVLQEEDFLNHQLYLATKSARIKRNRIKSKLWVVAAFLSFALLFYIKHDLVLATYFLLLAGLTLIFYPFYSRWHYRRHYQKFIQENYQSKIGKPVTYHLEADRIWTKDKLAENSLNWAGVTEIVEVPTALYIGLPAGVNLLLPKRLANFKEVKEFLLTVSQQFTIPYRSEIDWQWK